MSEPIISPWFIYFLDKIDSLRAILYLMGLTYLVYGFYRLAVKLEVDIKKTLLLFFIFSLLVSFVPGKSTLIKMYIAENITVERLAKLRKSIKEDVKELINYLDQKLAENRGSKKWN